MISQPTMVLNYIIALDGKFPPRAGSGSESIGNGFIGEVRLFAGDFAPKGWAFCHGQTLSISQNKPLFSLIGNLFGGDGKSTFALPDLRGRVPMGAGQAPGFPAYKLGQKGGAETITLIPENLPSHKHEKGVSTGKNKPLNIQQPYLAMTYLIAVKGSYPSNKGENPMGSTDGTLAEIKLFAGNFAPAGYVKCDGQLLSVNDHPTLFSVLGTTYGGDGRTNFKIPDLRGQTTIHQGTGPGLSQKNLVGEDKGNPPSFKITKLPGHVHKSNLIAQDYSHSIGLITKVVVVNYVTPLKGEAPIRGEGSKAPVKEEGMLAEIRLFAGNYTPGNMLSCDGKRLPINMHQALFDVIGKTYGSNGAQTFDIPDLRGRVVAGSGAGPGLSKRSLAESYGAEKATITVKNIPDHKH